MFDRTHALPLKRQAEVLQLSRSALFYQPRSVRGEAAAADRDRSALPPAAYVEARAGAQDLSVSAALHGGRSAEPCLGHGPHLYSRGTRLRLSRRRGRLVQPPVLAWRLSITMEMAFCLEAVDEALAKHGTPEIFNTDQGSQFISAEFTGLLLKNAIAISMDGKGAWRDNVFVERLWRSVKYEEVYLRAYDSVGEARTSIDRYLDFYNRERPHSSLDRRPPDEAYFDYLPQRVAA